MHHCMSLGENGRLASSSEQIYGAVLSPVFGGDNDGIL